jgi:hypothetical protein
MTKRVKVPVPWYAVEDVCAHFGVTFPTAKNQIQRDEFPVPTYRVGKLLVVDKIVYDEFFERRRLAGLRLLRKSTRG